MQRMYSILLSVFFVGTVQLYAMDSETGQRAIKRKQTLSTEHHLRIIDKNVERKLYMDLGEATLMAGDHPLAKIIYYLESIVYVKKMEKDYPNFFNSNEFRANIACLDIFEKRDADNSRNILLAHALGNIAHFREIQKKEAPEMAQHKLSVNIRLPLDGENGDIKNVKEMVESFKFVMVQESYGERPRYNASYDQIDTHQLQKACSNYVAAQLEGQDSKKLRRSERIKVLHAAADKK